MLIVEGCLICPATASSLIPEYALTLKIVTLNGNVSFVIKCRDNAFQSNDLFIIPQFFLLAISDKVTHL